VSKMISIAKHRESVARVKERESKPTRSLLRTLGMSAFAALVGYSESTGKIPDGFWKNDHGKAMVPTKVAGAAAAHLVAYFSRGTVHEVAHAAGDTLSITYGYAAGKKHAFVAGE
jgi:hypothetical protein